MAQVTRLITFVDLDRGGFSARLEAVLPEGSRIALLDDRGWMGPPRDMLSTEGVVATARMVVGPDAPFGDHTEAYMEATHWETLAAKLRAEGVEVDADELRALPRDVQMSDGVAALIRGTAN
jgi:hypothetical protein